MSDPILSASSQGRQTHFSQWVGVYIAAALSVLIGIAGWTAMTFFQVRDSIKELQDKVPIQLQAISDRLHTMEERQQLEDNRIYGLEERLGGNGYNAGNK